MHELNPLKSVFHAKGLAHRFSFLGLISNQGAGSKSIDERGPRIGGAHRARIGPRIGGLFWVLKGGRRKEEGWAGSANIAQSHQIYGAHRVAHRV